MTDTSTLPVDQQRLARAFEVLLLLAMMVMVLAFCAAVLEGTGVIDGSPPEIDATITNPESAAIRSSAIADNLANTSGTAVQLGDPVTAQITMLEPTLGQRAIWVLWQSAGPLLALVGTWLVYTIVRSVREGDPFVAANETRLWMLAGLIAVGGTVYSFLGSVARTALLQGSAAADVTEISFEIWLFPVFIGLGIAVLASVWRLGVRFRDDLEGTI